MHQLRVSWIRDEWFCQKASRSLTHDHLGRLYGNNVPPMSHPLAQIRVLDQRLSYGGTFYQRHQRRILPGPKKLILLFIFSIMRFRYWAAALKDEKSEVWPP